MNFKLTLAASAITAATLMSTAGYATTPSKPYTYEMKVGHVIGMEADAATDRYFVQLRSLPTALQLRDVQRTQGKLQLSSAQAKLVESVLAQEQRVALQAIGSKLGSAPQVHYTYSTAFNGFSMSLSEAEAEKLLELPQVLKVIRQVEYEMQTDVGPQHIGADRIWQDTTQRPDGAYGEGVVIAIIDSGINHDHPSFAVEGDDGYVHQNPFGAGTYFGDCEADASLCNDKLIGIYSYPEITAHFEGVRPANGLDYNGHGTHVASTAAGNILRNLPYYAPVAATESHGMPLAGSNVPQMSGVAPHANIVSFQVCHPAGGCAGDAMVKAVEDAIELGVDVINMSIGPSGHGPNPWYYPLDMAFLAAHEAGVFTSLSAGNSGPSDASVGHLAPWTTVVANATHNRVFEKQVTSSSGSLPALNGRGGVGQTVTGPIVYAADVDPSRAQCNFLAFRDYPEIAGKIVVCDRGTLALTRMAENVANHGGLGVIIRNTETSETKLHSLPFMIPGIQISRADGETLLSWMATEVAPEVTLSAGTLATDDSFANILNPTSSRGPYTDYPHLLVPHVTAPGTDIYAAFTDEQPFHFNPVTSDYGFLSGTSMAAPHVAGAAALLRQVNPDWTPAEIQSALMLTANTQVRKEDGSTPGDLWSRGAGMIQVDQAVKTGLVMDIEKHAFLAANPLQGGDLTALNTPYLTHQECPGSCTWTRTFRATQDATWNFSLVGGYQPLIESVEIQPAQITVSAGEEFEVTFTATFKPWAPDEWINSHINVQANDHSLPSLKLPLMFKPLSHVVPEAYSVNYHLPSVDTNELAIDGYQFRYPETIAFASSPLIKGERYTVSVGRDSDPRTPFSENEDGVAFFTFELDQPHSEVQVVIAESASPHVDMIVGYDDNFDGVPQEVERFCLALTSASVGEQCKMTNLAAGSYWVMVWNYQSNVSAGDVYDDVSVDVVLPNTAQVVSLATRPLGGGVPFENWPLGLLWNETLQADTSYYGGVEVLSWDDAEQMYRSFGETAITINQVDVGATVSIDRTEMRYDDQATVQVTLPANPLAVPLSYRLQLDLADGFIAMTDDQVGQQISLTHTVDAKTSQAVSFQVPIMMAVATAGEFAHHYQLSLASHDYEVTGTLQQLNPNEPPTLSVKASQNVVVEGDNFTLSAIATDANADGLTYVWRQTSGTPAKMSGLNQSTLSAEAPSVAGPSTLVFEVTVSDGEFAVTREVAVNVEQRSSGKLPFILLFLLIPLILVRRLHP
ncbi:S8 family peptidase [Pseudidiomarina sediminum]|uniref:S8 family peptidase n=1 Tax=Pseudidiomarina sediminum TaxID=431675 RepID=UPI001C989C93|nr:S8 family serine peptidase [Pseudidiomarina sediminum]MBY6064163.1 S8 family peptidase [Pseudidiomarina sediminum]